VRLAEEYLFETIKDLKDPSRFYLTGTDRFHDHDVIPLQKDSEADQADVRTLENDLTTNAFQPLSNFELGLHMHHKYYVKKRDISEWTSFTKLVMAGSILRDKILEGVRFRQ
jgi:hypothetical protein